MKVIVLLLATTALAVSSPIDLHRVQRHSHGRHVDHSGIQHASRADSYSSNSDRSESYSQSHHESSQMHSAGGHSSSGSISTVGSVNQGYSGHGVHGSSVGHSSGGHSGHGVHGGSISTVGQGYEVGQVRHLGQGQYVQGVGNYGSNGGVVEQTSIHQVTHGSSGGLTHGGLGLTGSGLHSIHQTHGLNSGVHGGSIGTMVYEQGVVGRPGNVGTLTQTIHNSHVTSGHSNGGNLNGVVTKETSMHQVTHGSSGGLIGNSGSSGAYVTDIDSLVGSQFSHTGGNVGTGQVLHTSVLNSGGSVHGSSGILNNAADVLYTGSQTHGAAAQHSSQSSSSHSASHSESHSEQSASQHSGHRESLVSTGSMGSSHGVHGGGSVVSKIVSYAQDNLGHGHGHGY